MSSPSLDALDRAVLHHLQANARESIANVADELDVADNTVRNRMHDLEASDVIEGYHASVNYDRADVQHYYFECTATVSERERLAGEARDQEGVVEVTTLVTGKNIVLGAGSEKDDVTRLASDLDELGLTSNVTTASGTTCDSPSPGSARSIRADLRQALDGFWSIVPSLRAHFAIFARAANSHVPVRVVWNERRA